MIEKLLSNYGRFKVLFEKLSEKGYHVSIKYQDSVLAEIGKDVTPSLFGVLGPVEIKDMDAVVKLAASLKML